VRDKYIILVGSLKGKDNLEDLDEGGMIMGTTILQ